MSDDGEGDDKVASMGREHGFNAMVRRSIRGVASLDDRINKMPTSRRVAVWALVIAGFIFTFGLAAYITGRAVGRSDMVMQYETAVGAIRQEQRRALSHAERVHRDQIKALAKAYEKRLEQQRAAAHARIAALQKRAAARVAEAGKTIERLKAENAKYRDYFDSKPPDAVAGIIWPDGGVRGDTPAGTEAGAGSEKPAAMRGGSVADSAAAVSAQTR